MKILENILDLMFIPKCGACLTPLPSSDTVLCDACRLKYEAEKDGKCTACGYPRKYCKCTVKNGESELPLVYVTGYATKRDSVSKQMVLHIKDNAYMKLIEQIAHDMAEAFRFRVRVEISEGMTSDYMSVFECNSENTYITWVPRSKRAYRKAGHDQAEIIAALVAEELDIPIIECFENVGRKAQKKLDFQARAENARKNHILTADSKHINGKNIIIIDDIVTTGASICACGEQLLDIGANKVIAFSFAKTESGRETYNDMPYVK